MQIKFKFDEKGLVPAIAQDQTTKQVLMLAYMNEESIAKTIETKKVHYFSRSRNKLWLKGETSGNFQTLKSFKYDCDKDTILLGVEQSGPACHTGNETCFFEEIEIGLPKQQPSKTDKKYILDTVYKVIKDRSENPVEGSYTNYLLEKGIDKVLKKVGEEASEIIIAAKNPDNAEVVYETSDLLYHLSVLMFIRNITWDEVFAELSKRR